MGGCSNDINIYLNVNRRISEKPCWNVQKHQLFEEKFKSNIKMFLMCQCFITKNQKHIKIPKFILYGIFDNCAINFLIQFKQTYSTR